MARLIIGDRRGVHVTGDIAALNLAVMEIIEGVTAEAMLAEVQAIADRAKAVAPVKSGAMRDGIDTYVEVNPTAHTIAVGITQTDPDAKEYQFFVRYAKSERNKHKVPPGQTPGGHFHWTNIRKPMNAGKKALLAKIDAALKQRAKAA